MRRFRLLTTLFLLASLLQGCGGHDGTEPASDAPPLTKQAAPASTDNTVTHFSGDRSSYTIAKTVEGYSVSCPGCTPVYVTGGTLAFKDVLVNLDVAAKAGSIPAADLNSLIELYVAYFNRVPDAEGMSYWIDQLKGGLSLESIGESFYAAAVQFSSVTGYSATMSNADFVKIVYKNVLGRESPDQDGLNYWTSSLANGSATRGTLIKAMLGSAHTFKGNANYGYVADTLENKVSVGSYFAVQQGLTYRSGADSITQGMAIAKAVTPTSISAALALAPTGGDTLNLSRVTPTCDAPKILTNGLCVAPTAPKCSINRVEKNGACVTIACSLDQAPMNGVCKPVICRLPKVFSNGVCAVPTCTPPMTLRYGVCAPPWPNCPLTQIEQNGTCVTPPTNRQWPGDYPLIEIQVTCPGNSYLTPVRVNDSPCRKYDEKIETASACNRAVTTLETLEQSVCHIDHSVGVARTARIAAIQALISDPNPVPECADGFKPAININGYYCARKPVKCVLPMVEEDGVCVSNGVADARDYPRATVSFYCSGDTSKREHSVPNGPCGYQEKTYIQAYSCPYGKGSSAEGKALYQCLADNSTGAFKTTYQSTADSFSGKSAPLTCAPGSKPDSLGLSCVTGTPTCTRPKVLDKFLNICVDSSTGSGSTGGSAGSGGTGLTAAQTAAANACASLDNYQGMPDTPQIESYCKIAYFDACIDKAVGTTTYKAEATSMCSIIKELAGATGSTYQCRYCPYGAQ